MLNRAIDFRDRASSGAEKDAWNKVIDWYNSFLKPEYRAITRNGAIGLPFSISNFDEVFRDRSSD